MSDYTYNTPVALLNAICSAVREKDGTTENIAYQDLPQRVLDIPSGGGSSAVVDSGTVTFTANSLETMTIEHDCGGIPNLIFITSNGKYSNSSNSAFQGALHSDYFDDNIGNPKEFMFKTSYRNAVRGGEFNSSCITNITDDSFDVVPTSDDGFYATTYYWFAIKV